MALELYDQDTFEGSIGDTNSEQLEVDTAQAEHVQVLVDNGTTGSAPAQYTLTQEYYQPPFDDYMQYSEQTAQTATSIRTSARGSDIRFTFTNTSGASDTYRIVVQSFKEI